MEIWVDVVGYEGLYQVSNLGRVRSLDRYIERDGNRGGQDIKGLILKPLLASNGYFRVRLCNSGEESSQYIHRVALRAFVGECPPGMECRHLNGINYDNRLENLRWGTHLDHMADRTFHAENGNSVRQDGDFNG